MSSELLGQILTKDWEIANYDERLAGCRRAVSSNIGSFARITNSLAPREILETCGPVAPFFRRTHAVGQP